MFKRQPKRKGRSKPVDCASDPTTLTMLLIRYEIKEHLNKAKAKPARVLPRRDKQYLMEIANDAFTNKQGQIFYNPSDRQLEKIFEGELYGYC